MGTKTVKGLLKSLRYISQIFEEDKEEEFQIGLPTDVKHVAHIGLDGPSANAPSWMNEFKNSPEDLSAGANAIFVGEAKENHSTKLSKEDVIANVSRQLPPIDSSAEKNSDGSKKSRPRGPSSSSIDSPGRKEKDSLGGSSRSSRRSRNSGQGSGPISLDSSGIPLYMDSPGSKDTADGSTQSSRRSRRPDPISEYTAEESPRREDTSGGSYRSSRQRRNSGPDPISADAAGECLSRKDISGSSSRSSRRSKKSGRGSGPMSRGPQGASEESRWRRKGSSGEGSVRSKVGSSDEESLRSKAKSSLKDEEWGLGRGFKNTELEVCEEEERY